MISCKWCQMRISRPKAIVLDIEGTIIDPNFSSRVLYPFMRNNVLKFLKDTFQLRTTQKMIDRLRDMQIEYKARSISKRMKMIKTIPAKKENNCQNVTQQCAEWVKYLYEYQPNAIQLLELQLLMWIWADDNELFKSQVFDEVPNTLHIWKYKNNIKIFVYSSALILVQKLLLSSSDHGNLLSLIDEFFDYKIGDKFDPTSYSKIVETLNLQANNILYITDSIHEVKCASSTGMKVALMKRNQKKGSVQQNKLSKKLLTINSIADILFKT